jgi:S1-C subfamily serine protease
MFERRKRGFTKGFAAVVLSMIGIAALFVFFISSYMTNNSPNPQVPQSAQDINVPKPQLIAQDTNTGTHIAAAVAKSAIPGVVGLSVLKVEGGSVFDRNATEKWGVGSGIIATSNGYIITNHHVAGGKNKRIIVSLSDGRNVDGVTVWSEPVLDLAVIKVNLKNLPTIPLGDSNTLQVGEPAIAIGNPLGLQFQRSVTSGIISALNRTIKIDTDEGSNYMEDLIQTDASINPGNSGGPLINSKGQVIGINTIKVTSAEGMGFAIPINVVVPIINQYASKGDFTETYFGVFAYDKEVAPYLDGNTNIDKGIYVANIDNSGPASRSGIKVGSIIKQVDGHDINTMMDLRCYIYSKKPGDTINVTYSTNGKTATTPIRLIAKERDGLLTR